MGRMGKQLIKTLKKEKHFKIYSLTRIQKINKKIIIEIQSNTFQTFKKTDVIIDFTIIKMYI